MAAQHPETDLAPPSRSKTEGAGAVREPEEEVPEMFPKADDPMDPVQESVSVILLGVAVFAALVAAVIHFWK
jgi:hypothetical protein